MIEFYLNGQPQRLDAVDPNMSILTFLRTKMSLTGTKEGCASGDCGACTVAIGSLDPQAPSRIRYDNVNSCIAVVGSLHGKHLVTVEALAGERPHPVQQAMVDHHAAQCGFCTPGIVMSLFTLHHAAHAQRQSPSEIQMLDALSGNLCRCTGYRPILAAGEAACRQDPATDSGAALPQADTSGWLDNPAMCAELARIANAQAFLELREHGRYEAPQTLDELRRLRRDHPEARLIAGGTDLMLEVTQQLKQIAHLIDLTRIEALQQIETRPDGLHIGAAVTYRELEPILSERWPTVGALLKRLGSSQIRNRGTLGGNIGNASPIGDMPPILIALGAVLELDSTDGVRHLPIDDFFLDYKRTALKPHEFIRGVFIPDQDPAALLKVYKVSKRIDDDISAVLGAFSLTLNAGIVTDCRLAYGGMAAAPKRAHRAERVLIGRPWDEAAVADAIAALAEDFTPMSDVRASADYRRHVAGNLIRRAWLETAPGQTRPAPTFSMTVFDYAHTHD